MKLTAFVLMPFATDFNDIYDHIIKKTLESIGFKTSRADDSSNARNIMHDVVQGIISADLIVADLTGSNANVYYELGIAHAFKKNVILITQEIDDVPFDLRAYRVVTYSTHFARIEEAKQQIIRLAEGSRDGSVHFGSPVTDCETPKQRLALQPKTPTITPSEDALGTLDIAADLHEGMSGITENMNDIRERIFSLGVTIQASTEKFSGEARHNPIAMRKESQKLASDLDEYASWLRDKNSQYIRNLDKMSEAMEMLFKSGLLTSPSEIEQLPLVIGALSSMMESTVNASAQTEDLANTLDILPKVERNFNGAKKRLAEEVRSLHTNMTQTISVLSRAKMAATQTLMIHNGFIPNQ